ncbi:energy transducer TonB [Undibacterium sp. SXout7W]|uniref:energy transducer TonB n=1 Tax=Undibacterium sp. SXout7W TaxID=3413049 RepID=UPI003BF1E64A
MTIPVNEFEHSTTSAPSRMVSLTLIVLLHVGFFYAIAHGLLRESVKLLPKEVFLTLIQPSVATPSVQTSSATSNTKPTMPTISTIKPDQSIPVPRTQEISNVTPDNASLSSSTATHSINTRQETDAASNVSSQSTMPAPQPKLLSAVEYLQTPQAIYPPMSRRMGEEGKVTLRILVNEKGHAEKVDVHLSSGFQRLDEAARSAVQKALFKPYLENGKALAVIATATINFSLDS